jgi:hypothetical protein
MATLVMATHLPKNTRMVTNGANMAYPQLKFKLTKD